jgi:hypothetical protein
MKNHTIKIFVILYSLIIIFAILAISLSHFNKQNKKIKETPKIEQKNQPQAIVFENVVDTPKVMVYAFEEATGLEPLELAVVQDIKDAEDKFK